MPEQSAVPATVPVLSGGQEIPYSHMRRDSHMVSAAELERLLDEVRRSAAAPAEGLFGPDSVSWKINRESACFWPPDARHCCNWRIPGLRRRLPNIPRTLHDPIGRFHQTFRVMFTMSFGTGWSRRLDGAGHLHRRHRAFAARCRRRSGHSPRARVTKRTRSTRCAGCTRPWWTARCWPTTSSCRR